LVYQVPKHMQWRIQELLEGEVRGLGLSPQRLCNRQSPTEAEA